MKKQRGEGGDEEPGAGSEGRIMSFMEMEVIKLVLVGVNNGGNIQVMKISQ